MTLQAPKDKQVLYMDMNAFFASVEQQANPALRGQPVGVTPTLAPSGCVIAASYEAKAYGVKVGDRVDQAKLKCPSIKIVEAHTERYLSVHRMIMDKLAAYGVVHKLSIDEAYLELDEGLSWEEVREMADSIRRDIGGLGEALKCSIGVGPNIFLAKVAAESRKPDGYTELRLAELPEFYEKLQNLTELPGIARRMKQRMHHLGIKSIRDLYEGSEQQLKAKLGVMGEAWHLRLHGYRGGESWGAADREKTMGHSHVLSPELRDPERALSVLSKLSERVAYRLRKRGLAAHGISLSLAYVGGGGFHDSIRGEAINDSHAIWQRVERMWRRRTDASQKIMHIAAHSYGLIDHETQTSLFGEQERHASVARAMDSVNGDYGELVLYPARMHIASDAAPVRIAFGQDKHLEDM